jgi:hypothetical protein
MPVNGGSRFSFDSARISKLPNTSSKWSALRMRWSAKPRFGWLRHFGGVYEMTGALAPMKLADARNACVNTALRRSRDSWIWRSVCICHIGGQAAVKTWRQENALDSSAWRIANHWTLDFGACRASSCPWLSTPRASNSSRRRSQRKWSHGFG